MLAVGKTAFVGKQIVYYRNLHIGKYRAFAGNCRDLFKESCLRESRPYNCRLYKAV